MNPLRAWPWWLAAVLATHAGFAADALVRREIGAERPGQAWSVTTADLPLAMTGQLLGWSNDGSVSGNAATQTGRVLDHLEHLLAGHGSGLARVVKLNVYLADDADHEAVASAIGTKFRAHPVPLAFVRTSLGNKAARVAIDAVAQLSQSEPNVRIARVERLSAPLAGAHVGVLPAGRKVFLSGLASRKKGFREGLREVFDGQRATMQHHGLKPADVAHVKAWLAPFDRTQDLQAELAAFFGELPIPPVVLIEWTTMDANEIEFVLTGASADPKRFSGPLAFATRPGAPASTRFSHVAFVEAGQPLIFIAGLYGRPGDPVKLQLQDIFGQLGRVLFDAGSGFRYLAKATYHNTDAPGRTALGEIRDVFFDPARPPAASGVVVRGVGRAGCSATLDMIAVPLPKP